MADSSRYNEKQTIINRIGTGYQLSSIVKEMMQNAEDAGASLLKFIHIPKNKYFKYHLLKNPCLMIVNDSQLTEDQYLEGLLCYDGDKKTSDPTKIGRFGIGHICIFHLADFPVYFWSETQPIFEALQRKHGLHNIYSSGKKELKDISGAYLHEEENEKNIREDIDSIINIFRSKNIRIFGLLLPVRTKEFSSAYGKLAVMKNTIEDIDEVKDKLSVVYNNVPIYLLHSMNLKKVSFEKWDITGNQIKEETIIDFSVNAGSKRINGINKRSNGINNIDDRNLEVVEGQIISKTGTSTETMYSYIMKEGYFDGKKYYDSPGWEDQKPKPYPAHYCISLLYKNTNESPLEKVNIFESVFYPIKDLDKIIKEDSLNVVIHGEFLVDSTRRHIIGEEGTKEKEKEHEEKYNEQLKITCISQIMFVLDKYLTHKNNQDNEKAIVSIGAMFEKFIPVICNTKYVITVIRKINGKYVHRQILIDKNKEIFVVSAISPSMLEMLNVGEEEIMNENAGSLIDESTGIKKKNWNSLDNLYSNLNQSLFADSAKLTFLVKFAGENQTDNPKQKKDLYAFIHRNICEKEIDDLIKAIKQNNKADVVCIPKDSYCKEVIDEYYSSNNSNYLVIPSDESTPIHNIIGIQLLNLIAKNMKNDKALAMGYEILLRLSDTSANNELTDLALIKTKTGEIKSIKNILNSRYYEKQNDAVQDILDYIFDTSGPIALKDIEISILETYGTKQNIDDVFSLSIESKRFTYILPEIALKGIKHMFNNYSDSYKRLLKALLVGQSINASDIEEPIIFVDSTLYSGIAQWQNKVFMRKTIKHPFVDYVKNMLSDNQVQTIGIIRDIQGLLIELSRHSEDCENMDRVLIELFSMPLSADFIPKLPLFKFKDGALRALTEAQYYYSSKNERIPVINELSGYIIDTSYQDNKINKYLIDYCKVNNISTWSHYEYLNEVFKKPESEITNYWDSIVISIKAITNNIVQVKAETKTLMKEKKWLRSNNGTIVGIGQIVHLEVQKMIPENIEGVVFSRDIDEVLVEYFDKNDIFNLKIEMIKTLFEKLKEDPKYIIAPLIPDDVKEEFLDMIAVDSSALPDIPGIRIINNIGTSAKEMFSLLTGEMNVSNVVKVLRTTCVKDNIRLFNLYLKEAKRLDANITDLELLSESGAWVDAKKLVFTNQDIPSINKIDNTQAEILLNAEDLQVNWSPSKEVENKELNVLDLRQIMRRYDTRQFAIFVMFTRGLFDLEFNDGIEAEYLKEKIEQEMRQELNPINEEYEKVIEVTVKALCNKSKYYFPVNNGIMANIFMENINITIGEDWLIQNHLNGLMLNINRVNDDGFLVNVPAERIKLAASSSNPNFDKCTNNLRNIISKIYDLFQDKWSMDVMKAQYFSTQKNVDSLKKEILINTKDEELIKLAAEEDNKINYWTQRESEAVNTMNTTELRKILVKKHNELFKSNNDSLGSEDLLEIIDQLRRQELGLINDKIRERIREKHLDDVTEIIKSNMKKNGYNIFSIPFEMFQNADDAANQENLPGKEYLQKVAFVDEKNVLLFSNNGRGISEYSDNDSENDKERYKNDIANLVGYFSSDKEKGGEKTTGKFGIGFKSVYFICNEPIIINKSIEKAIAIKGYFLPELPDSDKMNIIKQYYSESSELNGYTTFILQVINDKEILVKTKEALATLNKYAEYLVIFSKKIKKLIVSNREYSYRSEGLKIGEESILYNNGRLIIALKNAYIVFQLNESFKLAPFNSGDDMPIYWRVAPTDERAKTCVIISASFEIDIGRSKLLGKYENENLIILNQIKVLLKEKFKTILSSDESCINILNWKINFISSFFEQYIQSDNNDGDAKYLYGILSGIICELIKEDEKVIPSKLDGDYNSCVNTSSLKFYIPNEKYYNAIKNTNWFRAKVKVGEVIRGDVWHKVKAFTDDERCEEITLQSIIEGVFIPGYCIDDTDENNAISELALEKLTNNLRPVFEFVKFRISNEEYTIKESIEKNIDISMYHNESIKELYFKIKNEWYQDVVIEKAVFEVTKEKDSEIKDIKTELEESQTLVSELKAAIREHDYDYEDEKRESKQRPIDISAAMKEWSAIGIEQKKDLLFKYNCKIHYNYEKLLKGLKEGDKISYFQLILRGTLESISLWGNEGKTDSARNDFIRNAYNYDIMSPEKNIEKLIDFFDSEDNDDTIKHFNMFSRLAVISLYTRKIDEYVSQFRKPTGRFAILRPSIAEDARALKSLAQPLGIGGYFLKRELVRLGIIDYKAIHRDCYIPSKKVCDWFGVNYSQSRIERSGAIYNKIHAIDKDFDDFAIDKLPQFDVAIRIMKEKNII